MVWKGTGHPTSYTDDPSVLSSRHPTTYKSSMHGDKKITGHTIAFIKKNLLGANPRKRDMLVQKSKKKFEDLEYFQVQKPFKDAFEKTYLIFYLESQMCHKSKCV